MGDLKVHNDLKDFTWTHRIPPKKGGEVGALFCWEIGDLEGPGRTNDMSDAHSLKWRRAGFGPDDFNAISPDFSGIWRRVR